MRNRIAVWGRDAQEKRVLITIELQVTDNIVRIETFPEKVVTDEVYAAFMDKWRKGEEVELPEPDRVIARELSVSESLLPDDLRAEQTDMILRAQTEWHFHVLSEKLAQNYRSELAEIEDRIERAGAYSGELWNQAKAFWQKVQGQLQDKTLMREQGNELRKRSDAVFARLKELRQAVNAQYEAESAKQKEKFGKLLEDLETRINEGTHLNKVFQELREVQRKFHGVKFTKEDRDAIYGRIDAAFKSVKEKRGQGGGAEKAAGGGALGRNEARYQGLMKAMERMRKSISRDEEDLKFERRRIERTDGQLEAQIRQAKIVMIESRIASKNDKLADMVKTQTMLEGRIEKDKKRAEKEARKAAERQAKAAAKAKIAASMAESNLSPEEKAKLEAAAAAIKAGKKQAKADRKDMKAAPPGDLVANFAALSQVLAGEVHVPRKQRTAAPSLLDQATAKIDQAVDVAEHEVQKVVDTVKATAQVLKEEE
ncbi:chromosome segregation ATPase [Lewinella marina]|uniref:Uncharacterized protein n=1 Tax=Neolewinella marina TaxID=438751 RepID=A0A2G0CJ36_9BACT|nr:hypothetical protein [Neolewinella marina]NJB84865.1 chromosome segregation ATPase [Neolewinella marina]PHK99981.1 hypothetical protein CGL56_02745 [Neolewinella marina]